MSVCAYFLDVGQGDCTFVFDPHAVGRAILIDCRDAYVARRFVMDHGLAALAAIVVSHLDDDHIHGMHEFLRSFKDDGGSVGRAHVGIDRKRARLGVAAAHLIDALLDWEGEFVGALEAPCRGGDPVTVASGPGWSVEIVLPRHADLLRMRFDGREEPNSASCVVRVVCGGRALLIGGDAPLRSWAALEPDLFAAAVVRVPHHGGDLATAGSALSAETLYRHIGAGSAVVSVGTTNPYGHPYPTHVGAARRAGACRVLCTQLTRRCHAEPASLREVALESGSGVVYPYRHRRADAEVPCAGSVLVELEDDGSVRVDPAPEAWHDAFLDLLESPLCRHATAAAPLNGGGSPPASSPDASGLMPSHRHA